MSLIKSFSKSLCSKLKKFKCCVDAIFWIGLSQNFVFWKFLGANFEKNSLVFYFKDIFLFNVSVGRPIGLHCTWKIYLQHCLPISSYLRLQAPYYWLELVEGPLGWPNLLLGEGGLLYVIDTGFLLILYLPKWPLRRGMGGGYIRDTPLWLSWA